MQYVIAGIILILIVFLIGFISRKKYYAEIDRYEAWKIDIMNKPVSDELSRVKQLNMTGQTEELFDGWRQGWDEIVAVQLPDVEELLFDAEEYTDKFRFNKTKEVLSRIDQVLTDIEKKIEQILSELNELVGSEEKNREEILALQEEFRNSKKQLLAYRHTYGQTAKHMEAVLDKLSEKINQFNELTEQGNYLDAREIVLSLAEEMKLVAYKMETVPKLITDFENVLPSQLSELEAGYIEMKDQGYTLDHIEVDKEVASLKETLQHFNKNLEELQVEEVEEGIQEIKVKVESLYDLLEKEVHAKHFVEQYRDQTTEGLIKAKEDNDEIQSEVSIVKQGYHLHDADLSTPNEIDKKIIQLSKRHEMLMHKEETNATAFSNLSDELKDIRSGLEELNQQQSEFSVYLQNLRKDELATREKIQELKKKVAEASRMISKSNVPGLPADYKDLLDEVHRKIEQVNASLTEKPLNMKFIQETLLGAEDTVDHFYTKTGDLIENVLLSEKIIQYGNRYRSKYSSVREGLQTAEQAFRQYDYRRALEEAATTIEKVEPGALKKIEKMMDLEDRS
ncbi:septation ring formation regulator EzrA [Rossellomorea vietnamensis]|uniref:Septation ring formation regulator EzrA n=1 Tax=Rossellomorea vietnamensis TaxID=218284 RepID=A0A6I6UU47_9BACI|nr:septation ring formation regulator EzrA [Rossellomorea vietnamensis]OXS59450.1 septation ring formation regulator EzrA [Bacillus sp. DSM 27956]PRX75938.1 septation ring formation regulator [Bacillus sp. V-88]QHE62713.1 septation ring formation regulator EzrA [Rossellomorea vietnamensis]WQI95225.1 septation ring formation regulator EzrA [Rossellomorea vietnamensis]WQI95235.1 septation ring formation regulator EzrA [Rossellomorea vietnamensis]